MLGNNISSYYIDSTLNEHFIPRVGDTGVFIVDTVGKTNTLQLAGGSTIRLKPGQQFLGVFGNRRSLGILEGYLPDKPVQQLNLLGKGGLVGVVPEKKERGGGPTTLRLVGFACSSPEEVLNIRNLVTVPRAGTDPFSHKRVILSVGTSQYSGRTSSSASLVEGISSLKKKVAYLKITGMADQRDLDSCREKGATFVGDFTRVGYPSTYLLKEEELVAIFTSLLQLAYSYGPEVIIIELSDGMNEQESKMLLTNEHFMHTVEAVVLSSGDSISAIHGLEKLEELGYKPLAISGLFTVSPMLVDKVKNLTDVPVYNFEELSRKCKVMLFPEDPTMKPG